MLSPLIIEPEAPGLAQHQRFFFPDESCFVIDCPDTPVACRQAWKLRTFRLVRICFILLIVSIAFSVLILELEFAFDLVR